MSRIAWVLPIVGITAAIGTAAIPEPDLVVYGRIFVNRVAQKQSDNIQVIARVDRVPFGNLPGEEDVAIGITRLGELEKQRGACDGDDCFVLRVKVESLADGEAATGQAAVLGEQVHLCTKQGDAAEVCDSRDVVTAVVRGKIAKKDLGEPPPDPRRKLRNPTSR